LTELPRPSDADKLCLTVVWPGSLEECPLPWCKSGTKSNCQILCMGCVRTRVYFSYL